MMEELTPDLNQFLILSASFVGELSGEQWRKTQLLSTKYMSTCLMQLHNTLFVDRMCRRLHSDSHLCFCKYSIERSDAYGTTGV